MPIWSCNVLLLIQPAGLFGFSRNQAAMAKSLTWMFNSFKLNVVSTVSSWNCSSPLSLINPSVLHQQSRNKSKIHFCGYLEHASFKSRDIRYKTAVRHDTKRVGWQDFQVLIMLFHDGKCILNCLIASTGSQMEGCASSQTIPAVAGSNGLC